ncbi:multidrug efflux MFS transporter [Staphylococcus simulans]|uniref:MDR family MFS transporter n=1 Tax=Staphylococcus simulans TaxID=1286 RepID=UPI001E5A9178|nr:MDR family MFS transporter [Staphylococcus simulans]MCD8916303.1 multidrug efflux MFS transporter [Staphylococcus simulans]
MTSNYSTRPVDIHGKPYNPTLIMVTMLLATFSGVLMQTSLGTALPTLMHDFDIDFATAQQATTWFLLANGVMIPLSAFFATRFPTKLLHILAYSILLIGLAITALAPSSHHYWFVFLVGRIISAVSVGMMMPLMQMLIINMYPPKKRGVAMGLTGLAIGLAPAIGPTFAGWILNKDHIILGLTLSNSWRNIFIVPIAVMVIALVLCIFLMKDIIPNRKLKLDIPSFILSVFGFGLFLWGFSNVASEGWGSFWWVILPIIASLFILTFFVVRQLKMKDPFLDLRVFKNRNFTFATLGIVLITMAMFGVEMMLPTYLQNIHGFSPLVAGLTLLPGALLMGITSPISGALYNKVGVKRLAFVGFFILSVSTIPFAFLSGETSTTLITVLYAIRIFSIALIMMPLTAFAMDSIPTEVGTHGTAVNNTARQMASSIGVALLTSVTQNIINNNEPKASLKDTDPFEFMRQLQHAMIDGFNTAFAIGLVFAILGLALVPFLGNNLSKESEETK